MTLTIGKYSPINIAKVENILKTQYIVPIDDINTFLLAHETQKGLVEFEGETYFFEAINLNITRQAYKEVAITTTHSKLDINNLLKIMEEQNGTN